MSYLNLIDRKQIVALSDLLNNEFKKSASINLALANTSNLNVARQEIDSINVKYDQLAMEIRARFAKETAEIMAEVKED